MEGSEGSLNLVNWLSGVFFIFFVRQLRTDNKNEIEMFSLMINYISSLNGMEKNTVLFK